MYDPAAAEIWTLGILLYTMVTGSTAFQSLDDAMLGAFRRPRSMSADCLELIASCLQAQPQRRATIDAVRSHRWLMPQSGVRQ